MGELPHKIQRVCHETLLAACLVEKNWQLICSSATLAEKTSCAPAVLCSLPQRVSQLDVLMMYIPDDIWGILAIIANRNLAGHTHADSRYRTTTPNELKKWYAIQ